MALDAIVVLGCRAGQQGQLFGAARRRVERAAQAYADGIAPVVIASGGKRWFGRSEADAFAARLMELGVPTDRIVREQRSLTTRGNAHEVAEIVRERGLGRIGVVTCDWHMRRALCAFARYSIAAEPLPAPALGAGRAQAVLRFALERVRALGDALVVRVADRRRGSR